MIGTIQLYQDGGCSGPRGTIETTLEQVFNGACAWAEGQVGHPWDGMLVNVYESEEDSMRGAPVETLEIECNDGCWEAI